MRVSPDLSSLDPARTAFREATYHYGCMDILANNAGTPFMEHTEETFDKVMALTVKDIFNATHVAAECMIARETGMPFYVISSRKTVFVCDRIRSNKRREEFKWRVSGRKEGLMSSRGTAWPAAAA